MVSRSKTKNILTALSLLMAGGAVHSAPAEAGWRHGYGGYGYDRVVVRHVYRPVVRRHVVVRHVYRPVVRRVVIHHYPVYRPRPRPIYVSDGWAPPPWRYHRWHRPWHRPWSGGWRGDGRMCWIEPWLCR
ncbi:MAG TPA: hypothetical protein VHG30_05995 [Microvirga sp.]|nr:hypothetical protein [Microvirga sp.]